MFFKIFTITSFLFISCILNVQAYPDNLLNKPYSVQYFGVDTLFEKINKDDSAKVYHEIGQLEKWAEDNGDQQLKCAFILKEYWYSLRWKDREKTKVETGLPPLIKELTKSKMPELELDDRPHS